MRIYVSLMLFILSSVKIYSQQPGDYLPEGGYVNSLSVEIGEVLQFHISTSSPTYQINIYKLGLTHTLVYTSPVISGGKLPVPDSAYSNGCNWPVSFSLLIDQSWKPGVYSAQFPVASGNGEIVFSVRSPNPGSISKILVIMSTNTMQAYNNYGGKSIYNYNSTNLQRAVKVSFNRPFTYTAQYDYYAWENDLVNWLEQNKFDAEFASDVDIEKYPDLLSNYNVVIYVGHEEYWSLPERVNIQSFADSGGRVMFLSGNTCWWQVRFEDNYQTMACYKSSTLDPLTGVNDSLVTVNWYAPPVVNPEDAMTGVSYRFGGYVNFQNYLMPSDGYGGYTAYNTQNWIYKGSGLKDGDIFGQSSTIVGYETDGARFTWQNGVPVSLGQDGTPANFQILGISKAGGPDFSNNNHAVMGIHYTNNNGAIFTASTTDWVDGLVSDTSVQRITLNILNTFLSKNYPPDIISWSPSVVTPKNINNEDVYVSDRDSIVLANDSLVFKVTATDPFNGQLGYIWTVDGNIVSTDSAFVYHKDNTAGSKNITAYAYNSIDTASISWTLYTSNDNNPIYSVSGLVNYDNSSNSPMDSIHVLLVNKNSGQIISTHTNVNGIFVLNDIPAGNYYLTASSPIPFQKSIVNSTDALVVARYYLHLVTLDSYQTLAGDVSNNGIINSTDALGIIRRFVGLSDFFNKSDWLFDTLNISITNSSLSDQNLVGIAAGDVNSSYTNSSSKKSVKVSLNLNTNSVANPGSNDDIEIPIRAASGITTAAFSIVLNYPADELQFESIASRIDGLVYKAENGKLAIAWVDLSGGQNPFKLSDGDLLFNIKFKLINNVQANNSIMLSLNDESEFSSTAGQPLEGVLLEAPEINISSPQDYMLEQNYPNPFNPSTIIKYQLPKASWIRLIIYNILGKEIAEPVNGYKQAGWHEALFSSMIGNKELASGIYFYRLIAGNKIIDKKMILEK